MTDEPIVASETEAKAPKAKSNRRKYRDDTWTDEQVAARLSQLSVETVPENWIKLAVVSDACRAAGIPVSKLVKATGGDRCMKDPVTPLFKTVFHGRTRYLSPLVLTEGLEYMKTMTTTRAPRAKKEKAEGDSGPVKSAKSAGAKRPPVTVRATPIPQTGVSHADVWEAPKK